MGRLHPCKKVAAVSVLALFRVWLCRLRVRDPMLHNGSRS
jgi:hypothetical protein